MEKRRNSDPGLKWILLAAGLALSNPTMAAQPWVAVPSAMNGGEVVITGAALNAGEAVTVQVTDPTGQKYSRADVADANGAMSVHITPGSEGKHKVDVYNAASVRIGGGDFLYTR